eukprot:m.23458 g.23458  ORF g.23458 m.23458 type:complete len:277 (+) comp28478_c0_seq5:118-948(+)
MKVFIVGDYTMQMEEIKIQFERYLIFSGKDQLTVLRRDRFNAAKSGFTDDSRFVFFLPVQERYAVYDDADVANSFKLEIDEVQPEKVVIILAYRQSTDTGRLRHSEVEKLWSNGPQKALRDFDDKGRILTCKDSLNDFQVERLREILQLEIKRLPSSLEKEQKFTETQSSLPEPIPMNESCSSKQSQKSKTSHNLKETLNAFFFQRCSRQKSLPSELLRQNSLFWIKGIFLFLKNDDLSMLKKKYERKAEDYQNRIHEIDVELEKRNELSPFSHSY